LASSYEILSGEHTVELIGATDVQDVYQVTARVIPAGTVFHVRFTPVIDNPDSIRDILTVWAGWYNDIAALPGVVGVSNLQDIDASGQLNDIAEITVRSNSGRLSQTIAVGSDIVGTPKVAPLVASAVDALNAIEAG
jgi:hypothetical protein